ncbi:MAG: response regulator [Bryobacterales bacterium]|nr:response regulator [Bryobacterales bacterium]
MARNVLVVEDTDIGQDALELALARVPNIVLQIVSTAEEALALLGENTCALVTDLNLPRMDGFELIEAVRSDPGRQWLPIMVISGNSDPDTPSRLVALGANAYFPKPFSPAEVRSRLEQLIHAS